MEPNNNPDNNQAIAGAVTYPVPAEGAMQPLPEQPRQPQNLQGLLRFAMEARQEDPPAQVELAPMDNQRREFLELALQSMVMDVVDILRQTIPILKDVEKIGSLADKEEISSEVKTAFESLSDVIEDVDVANDFCKIGGFDVFDLCYETQNPELWVYTNDLLAGVCQNFPSGQALALERGLLKTLLDRLRHPDTKHKEKFIYALSCCVREYSPGARSLVSFGGCELLAPLLAEPPPVARCGQRVASKAACLLRHLLQHYKEARERITALNLPKILVPQLKHPDEATEHLLHLLRTYVDSRSEEALNQSRDPQIGLKAALQGILVSPTILKDKEQNREIIEYATDSLSIVFGEMPLYDCEEEADR